MKWQFVIAPLFLEKTIDLQKSERANIWKSLKGLEREIPAKGVGAEKVKGTINFESCRISDQFRIIFSRRSNEKLISLLFVGNHDVAYKWARSQGTRAFQQETEGEAAIPREIEPLEILHEESTDGDRVSETEEPGGADYMALDMESDVSNLELADEESELDLSLDSEISLQDLTPVSSQPVPKKTIAPPYFPLTAKELANWVEATLSKY